jgi:hypothetical protein
LLEEGFDELERKLLFLSSLAKFPLPASKLDIYGPPFEATF